MGKKPAVNSSLYRIPETLSTYWFIFPNICFFFNFHINLPRNWEFRKIREEKIHFTDILVVLRLVHSWTEEEITDTRAKISLSWNYGTLTIDPYGKVKSEFSIRSVFLVSYCGRCEAAKYGWKVPPVVPLKLAWIKALRQERLPGSGHGELYFQITAPVLRWIESCHREVWSQIKYSGLILQCDQSTHIFQRMKADYLGV